MDEIRSERPSQSHRETLQVGERKTTVAEEVFPSWTVSERVGHSLTGLVHDHEV